MKRAAVFLAEGFEEVEALTVVDLLRRADIKTDMIALTSDLYITGRSGITVKADLSFLEAEPEKADILVLPGGQPGTKNLGQDERLKALLLAFQEEGKPLAAICAAPTVLGSYGILSGKRATCYPGCEGELAGAEIVTDEEVVTDGPVITSRGAGTAIPFALEVIRILKGEECADEVRRGIIFRTT
jgi:4-methyl-5(b-hydroxyethyl)-thiazole monophosphate biosynthesis